MNDVGMWLREEEEEEEEEEEAGWDEVRCLYLSWNVLENKNL